MHKATIRDISLPDEKQIIWTEKGVDRQFVKDNTYEAIYKYNLTDSKDFLVSRKLTDPILTKVTKGSLILETNFDLR